MYIHFYNTKFKHNRKRKKWRASIASVHQRLSLLPSCPFISWRTWAVYVWVVPTSDKLCPL